jgi:hypothetical protein
MMPQLGVQYTIILQLKQLHQLSMGYPYGGGFMIAALVPTLQQYYCDIVVQSILYIGDGSSKGVGSRRTWLCTMLQCA